MRCQRHHGMMREALRRQGSRARWEGCTGFHAHPPHCRRGRRSSHGEQRPAPTPACRTTLLLQPRPHLEGKLEEAGGQGRAGQGGQDASVAAHALGVGNRSVHLRGSGQAGRAVGGRAHVLKGRTRDGGCTEPNRMAPRARAAAAIRLSAAGCRAGSAALRGAAAHPSVVGPVAQHGQRVVDHSACTAQQAWQAHRCSWDNASTRAVRLHAALCLPPRQELQSQARHEPSSRNSSSAAHLPPRWRCPPNRRRACAWSAQTRTANP